MALRLEDKWIWDSWYAFHGERYHAFYLHASRALGDPVRRHRNPIVGKRLPPARSFRWHCH
jgi:beta-fructofuranosidase